jgi:hypothetical protein
MDGTSDLTVRFPDECLLAALAPPHAGFGLGRFGVHTLHETSGFILSKPVFPSFPRFPVGQRRFLLERGDLSVGDSYVLWELRREMRGDHVLYVAFMLIELNWN